MARQANIAKQNNFSKGLITEATGLNFPEDACTETFNCIFERTGRVVRRDGMEFEDQHLLRVINRNNKTINSFVWKNVSGSGTTNFFVLQVGTQIQFWDASTSAKCFPLSANFVGAIDIAGFLPLGSAQNVNLSNCQFASGYGYLFVFNPVLEPFYVSYNPVTNLFTAVAITLKIRDFKGLDDGYAVTERPVSMNDFHRYNLGNQGWTSFWTQTSVTSHTIGTGAKAFDVSRDVSLTSIKVGDQVVAVSRGSPANFMSGFISNYVGTIMTINMISSSGAGTFTDWDITQQPSNIDYGWFKFAGTGTGFGNFPSNADVWWYYKDSTGVYSPSTTMPLTPLLTRQAPKGHFILDLFNQDRSKVSSFSSFTVESTTIRPSTGTFFAGRVWYAGINQQNYNNQIYFSQIVENADTTMFGKCYQENDPTSETLFDLLLTDGGVITIQDVDIIHKLIVYRNMLLVFASNGIWAVSGSSGTGFFPNDYTVEKLDAIPALSPYSFVLVQGTPVWWSNDGIYTLEGDKSTGRLKAVNMTNTTIASFYNDIPIDCKKFAKGAYNKSTYIIQWIYPTTTDDFNSLHYNGILNFNTITGAWYPWTISGEAGGTNAAPSIHEIFVVEDEGGLALDSIFPTNKYVVSYPDSGTYVFSFAEEIDTDKLDWTIKTGGLDYESTFTTGYAVHADGIRRYQTPYVMIFSETPEDVDYVVTGKWDYGRSSVSQHVALLSALEDTTIQTRKLKVRGQGKVFQLKIDSFENKPFYLIGWAVLESSNAGI